MQNICQAFPGAAFMPHGHCYLWKPSLVGLHVASDGLIALAYYSIPVTLLLFYLRRPDTRMNWMLLLFAGFITACGTTHLMSIYTLWVPAYWAEGAIKVGTAGISLAAAGALWPLLPRVLAVPSPAELEAANARLRDEVAARQRVEADLRDREAQLSDLVENFRLGILVHRHYQPLYANPAFAEALGFDSPEAFIQAARENPPGFYVHPDDREGAMNRHEARLAKTADHPTPVEWRAVRLDGTVVWFETTHRLVEWEGATALQTTHVDITERKRAQETLQDFNRELERGIAERTAELQRANEELESFSYSVAHDLRQPLRSMRGFSRILLEDYAELLDGETRDYLRRIDAASDRMHQLIEGVLALARISRVELEHEDVDLSAAVRRLVRDLREQEPARRVTVEIADGLVVRGDPRMLRGVVENLIGNAWKFTGGREDARIELGAERAGDETVFHVRDNGAGFDMSHADQLFGPFQRLHRPGEFPGHGIGLATVRRAIERHGGRVWAEGAPGRGATFFFTLGAARTGGGNT